ncbi:triacylglycerol lipase [Mycobacterium sp. ITM-2016-00318]|uniref:esterase/lipase family protein n=1 Tax=Mycobacterium sp. ITM-2016-00318 TaxID=2099693 RepID=UPI001E3B9392|nr:alpha/beta fold hydrolase [Mycobacterium sp. ITM-2016-00318]WNG92185.1 alpha/beta fold hydrolase [Mycobacterium sp. ITM-2016-00318]
MAAFVLSAWMTVAVTGGVAHADSPPPSDAGPTSEGAPSGHASPSGTPESSKPESSKRPTDLRDRLTRHLRPENRIRATQRDDTKKFTTSTAPRRDSARDSGTATPVDEEEAIATPEPPTASVAAAKPRRWEAPRALHGDRRLDLISTAVDPIKPRNPIVVAAERSPLADVSVRKVDPTPSAAAIASVDPPGPEAPRTFPGPGAIDIPQLGRQGVGLASDVGVVTASVVYTVAHTFAQVFGPNDFLGVPYALATALANTAAAASRTLIGAPLDASSPGRFPVTYGVLDGLSFFNPQKPPPGANDPSIKVTDEHPLPIILVNGTTATQGTNWSVGAPVLANAGYKVYTFNYGNVTGNPNSPIQATGDIEKSAEELDDEIDRVLAETGAEKVILIGHSQGGGILPAYYINNVEGGADKVSQVIGIAPSNHGTDFNGLAGLLSVPVAGPLVASFVNLLGPAFIQQTVGSDFQQEVYGEQETDPRVQYTNIITRNDEIVTPYTQQALEGDNVTNIILHERYPGYPAGHLGVVLSPQVWSIVLDALEANPEANPQLHPAEELAA